MSGNDRLGKSQFEGLLMFKEKELSLKLSKLYVDRLKARQNDDFDILTKPFSLYKFQGF
jgi:hypothetical protein